MRKAPKKGGEKARENPEWVSVEVIQHALTKGICSVIPGTHRRGLVSTLPDLFVIFPDRQLVCMRCQKVEGVLKATSKEDEKTKDFAMRLRGWLMAEGKKHVKCKEVTK